MVGQQVSGSFANEDVLCRHGLRERKERGNLHAKTSRVRLLSSDILAACRMNFGIVH